jgi:hypothetical protein
MRRKIAKMMATLRFRLEQADRHARVELGRRQPRVAEDLLDHADVGAVLQHPRVAQQVTGALLGDPRRDHVVAGQAREMIRLKGPAPAREEDRGRYC